MTVCRRCGVGVEARTPPGEDARMLRRSTGRGVCANCAVTLWFKGMEPIASILADRGPELLLDERARSQFERVMESGLADMDAAEIDWGTVVAQWGLPS